MSNITESNPNVKASVPVPSMKDMTPAQMQEEITIKIPRGIAAFLAEDLERLAQTAILPGAPPPFGSSQHGMDNRRFHHQGASRSIVH